MLTRSLSVYFFYPETANLSLEQVDLLFTGGKVLMHWKPGMGERQGSFAVAAADMSETGTPPNKENYGEKTALGVQHVE